MKKPSPVERASRAAFNQRLLGYSATAAVVIAAPAAEATITNITQFSINSSAPSPTPPDDSGIDLPFAGVSAGGFYAVTAALRARSNSHGTFAYVALLPTPSNGIAAGGSHALRLASGSAIAGKAFGFSGQKVLATRHHGASGGFAFLPTGPNAVQTGYIGFKNIGGSHAYYGWLRVKVTNDANGMANEVSLVAKDGDPGIFGAYGLTSDNITAGEISAIPEPSSVAMGLGLLALGAAGVREMRRRRQTA